MVTVEQYANRLIEWVSSANLFEALSTFEELVEDGEPPATAFEMVVFLFGSRLV